MVEKVSNALDTGQIVVGVFLDLKKTFDMVHHDIEEIYAYGIRGNINNWFKSYFKYRKQYVFLYNNIPSDIGNITHGVPQESILGPLLFILYMNNFSRTSNLLFSILYADETNIFIEGTEYHKVINTLNTELLKVSDWLNSNKLTINLELKNPSINLVILKKQ